MQASTFLNYATVVAIVTLLLMFVKAWLFPQSQWPERLKTYASPITLLIYLFVFLSAILALAGF